MNMQYRIMKEKFRENDINRMKKFASDKLYIVAGNFILRNNLEYVEKYF